MLRYLSPLLQLTLVFLFTIFSILCYREWLAPETCGTQDNWACGTVSPAVNIEPEIAEAYDLGKFIFRNNCAACHAGDMKTDLTGPALGGATERWAEYGGQEALYAFIRNSQAMIKEGQNERAQLLWEEWGPTVMNSFLNLSDEELDAVLLYIDQRYVYYGTTVQNRINS